VNIYSCIYSLDWVWPRTGVRREQAHILEQISFCHDRGTEHLFRDFASVLVQVATYVDEVMDIVELNIIQFDLVGSGNGHGE
jgi:hypothetical protein